MKNRLVVICMLLFTVLSYPVMAQFSLSGELRTRGEVNNGYKYLPVEGDDIQFYLSQRTRINAMWTGKKYNACISIQDVRSWGGEDVYSGAGVWADNSGLDVYQAWAEIILSDQWHLKVGRQELKYDDERLLSWRDWNQYGLTYDAAVLKYQNRGWRVDAGFSYNSLDSKMSGDVVDRNNLYYSDKNRMKTQNFLYVKKTLNESLALSGIFMETGYLKPGTANTLYMTHTLGLHANYSPGDFKLLTNAYMQRGRRSKNKDLQAVMFTIDASYKTKVATLGAGVDYFSGDDASADSYGEKDKTFDLFYGARFKYSGWMNMFILPGKQTNNAGLIDFYPYAALDIAKKSQLKVYYHLFSLAHDALVQQGDENLVVTDHALGSEIDVMMTHEFSKEFNMKAGFSYYITSNTMEMIKGVGVGNSESPYWGWVMLTFKPRFI